MAGAVPLNPKFKFTDANGDPLAMGWLTVFLAGTSTLANTYTDQAQTIPNTNPVHLDANGEATLWTDPTKRYKWLLQARDPITGLPGVTVPGWPVDNIPGGASDTMATDLAGTGGAGMIGFASGFPGSILQTVEAVLREVVSVKRFGAVGNGVANDTTAIAAAVAYASGGRDLFWPAGTYITTVNIPGFHSVRHLGAGAVQRGSDTFYVQPRGSQSNKIYVAPTGSPTNDGLSLTQPMATFQNAFDALQTYGPVLDGTWTIQVAAGTYTISTGQQSLQHLTSRNRVIVTGPTVGHPNVPTCIVDGGSAGANFAHGLAFVGAGLLVSVRDIKFQNFKGDPSGSTRGALLFDDGCDAHTDNVHVIGSTWFGVYYSRGAAGRHAGGIIDACRNGVNTDQAKVTVGYGATSLAGGTIIRNCTESGAYWVRGTDGHTDYVTFDNNSIGLFVDANSRTDSVGCDFKNNTVGVRTANGGIFGDNSGAPCNFNIGTASANSQYDVDFHRYSGGAVDGDTSESWARVAYDRTLRTASGIVAPTLSTPYTIPAGRMRGGGKSARVMVRGIYTVTAGSSVTVTFGGMSLTLVVPGAAASVVFMVDVELHEVAGGYRAFGTLTHTGVSARTGNASAGFTNTAAQAVTVACSLVGAGDSINVYRTDVYLMG